MSDTIAPNEQAVRDVAGRQVPAASTYTLDPSHSTVEFVAKHLMISKVRGRFSDVNAKIAIAEVPEESHVEVTMATASVSTGDAKRDEHLRSADFFDVEHHPAITFNSTKVEPVRHDRWEVTGDLAILGVSKPVVLEVEFLGAGQTPWGTTAIGFTASTEVDREEWGLTWNAALETGGVLVGKKVRIELEVEATRDQ